MNEWFLKTLQRTILLQWKLSFNPPQILMDRLILKNKAKITFMLVEYIFSDLRIKLTVQ